MTRTSPLTLVTLALIAGVLGFGAQLVLASGGRPGFIPPVTLGFVLIAIGVLDVLCALPVRRATRAEASKPVDPFYATRVLILAKSSALTGALLGGAALGSLLYFLLRAVPTFASALPQAIVVLGGIVALVGGLVAEKLCRLPPDDPDADPQAPTAPAGA